MSVCVCVCVCVCFIGVFLFGFCLFIFSAINSCLLALIFIIDRFNLATILGSALEHTHAVRFKLLVRDAGRCFSVSALIGLDL